MTLLDERRWKRLSPLLDELLDLDVAARTLRLGDLRALDAALADELEALLGAARRAQACGFLDGNALDSDLPPSPPIDQRSGADVIDAAAAADRPGRPGRHDLGRAGLPGARTGRRR